MSKKLIAKLVLYVAMNFCTNILGSQVNIVNSFNDISFNYLKNGTYRTMGRNKTWEFPPSQVVHNFDRDRFNESKLIPCALQIIDENCIEIATATEKYQVTSKTYVQGLLNIEFDAQVTNQLVIDLNLREEKDQTLTDIICLKVTELIKPVQNDKPAKEPILPAQAIFLKQCDQSKRLTPFFSDQQMPEKIPTIAKMCALKVDDNFNSLIHPCDGKRTFTEPAIPIEKLSADKVETIMDAINTNQEIFAFISDNLYRIRYVYNNDKEVAPVKQINKQGNGCGLFEYRQDATPGNKSIPLIIGGLTLCAVIAAFIIYCKNPDKIANFYAIHLAPLIKSIR